MPVYNHFYLISSQFHPDGLKSKGAILNVEISIPTSIAEIFDKEGKPIPQPQTGLALFDTGASATCVDKEVIGLLGIPSIGIETVYTPQGSDLQNKYPGRLGFPGTTLPTVEFGAVYGASLKAQGIMALIGRDLLSHFVFTYNGPGGFITIAH